VRKMLRVIGALVAPFLGIFLAVELPVPASGQTLTSIASFDGTDGEAPGNVSLIQGTDGNFYGTTEAGGRSRACLNGCGTIFNVTPDGVVTTLLNFDDTNGESPLAGIFQASNGNFYGTTYGDAGYGTLFKLTPAGKLTTLANNLYSYGAIIEAGDGNLYGASANGGTHAVGSVFKISSSDAVSTIYSFSSSDDGPYGPSGGLVQATDGNFYGVTKYGGRGGSSGSCDSSCGAVFRLTPSGKLFVLYNFCSSYECADGFSPVGALIQASDGNLYGTTPQGGVYGGGTVFRITTAGELTSLYSFCSQENCVDGQTPYGPLVQATDGNLYGTTEGGGSNFVGTIYRVTLSGVVTTIQSFNGGNGAAPYAGLLQSTNGRFYGATLAGGSGDGVVYSFDMGLGPFIMTNPTAGGAGAQVIILGNDLNSASSVTFDGEAAKFRVVSSTEIIAVVPEDATTGTVEVVTSGATLKSKAPFRVVE
jgi:uncharacterized repeat protein (TIGR03803 family)